MERLRYIVKDGVHNLHYDFNESRCELMVLFNQRQEPLHIHDFNELVVIFGGSAVHAIDDQEYPIVRGDVFIVRGNHKHTFKNLDNLNVANFLFRRDYFENLMKEFANLPGFKELFVYEPRYRKNQKFKSKLHLNSSQLQEAVSLLNTINKEQAGTLSGYEEAKERFFELLIIKICRDYSTLDQPHSKSLLRISKAIDYIENNYSKKITICSLANISGMSESNFRFCFKKITGLSPIDFLVKLRIEKAVNFMTVNSSVNVTQTAMETGFYDSAYFSKKFKNIVGMTPMAFLKKQRSLGDYPRPS